MCNIMTCSLEAKMLTNGTGLLAASASKNMNMNHNGGGSTKLAVKWWSRSAKKHNSSTCPQIGQTWHTKVLAIWVLAAFIVSVYIFCSMNTDIIERRNEVLVSMCDERARMLQDQFAVSMNHVHALAILVSTFHHRKQPSAIDQKTFAQYTARTAFERPLMSGVAYAQKVLHVEREKFERQQGWTIKMMKSKEPSPVQDEYAPAIFSQETISYIASLDMMSGEEDRENILRARATGKAVLTSPFRLLESNHLGVVLTFAVYDTDLSPDATEEERIKATAGYLGGAFDVESLVENLLRQLAGNQAIVVNVYDITNNSMPLIMYGPPQVKENGMSHVSALDFGDPFRKHEMHCRFQQKPPVPWSAVTTSFGVFVIAFLIGHILYAAVNHIAKVEDDFRKMEELKKRAEAADVAKSQFLATVSHEIRTPMNGVLGMLQMLLDTDLDATQQDYARTAQASGKALITLINEVLDRAKIESGRLELEMVPFDLRAILDDVLSLFSGKTRDKGIELAVFVSDRVPELLIGDPGRFRQIITNLVGNSVKFTEDGHIFVHVHLAERVKSVMEANAEAYSQRTTEEVQTCSKILFNTLSGSQAADKRSSWETFKLLLSDGVHQQLGASDKEIPLETFNSVKLVVIVEDTGIGIPLHAQERVFMPFMQADSSTSRTYGGTGIGLSISRCLVELMGGEIKFVSRPHIGSTFTFTALLRKSDTNSLDDLKRPQSESLPTRFTGMKAVVVDERHVRAQVTKYHLQRLGIQVEVAYDIKSALAVISGRRNGDICSQTKMTDMIVVDKESWGLEMALTFPQLLRDSIQNGRGRLPPESPKMILLATSITSLESEKAKAAGFVETVIMKPLRASMVAACLQQELGLGSKRQQGKGLMDGTPFLQSLLFGKKILVVDDNKVNRRVAAGALKKYGANVECAESGKTAIAKLQLPHKFDACFMDVQMPEMDGFEATRQIRNMEENVNKQIESGIASKEAYGNVRKWHVPIFAMTADVIHATYEECLRCGMDGYVSKPFEEEELYRAVAQFCESNPSSKS